MDYLFDIRPERPGYRLQKLELLNWGTFDSSDGHVYRFEPKGRTSLLVGHNGSGKSTLVDAILTLLVEPRTRNYNVAAGARKTERTEKSYIRGAYARTSDDSNMAIVKYLRPQASQLSAIAAVFGDEQLGKSFTLCQVLHLASDGSTEKLFAIADEPRALEEDLAGVRQADELAEHLHRLGYETTKKFVKYRSWLTRRTGMLPKAMDMFNQTVAVKDIQSLDRFIRDHMLERHNWQETVSKLLAHFHDLSVAHQELVRTRKAEELLGPVESLGLRFRDEEAELSARERQLAAAATFFHQQTVDLLVPALVRQRDEVHQAEQAIAEIKLRESQGREQIRQLRNEIDQAGGERLKAIPQLMAVERAHLAAKQSASERYHELLRTAGIDCTIDGEKSLAKVQLELQERTTTTTKRQQELETKYEELVIQRGEYLRAAREDEQELATLGNRSNNLPSALVAMRQEMCADLGLKTQELPFAAELITVAADERRWEASAQLVLRSFAQSLLVPEPYYARVRAYIDRTKLVDPRGRGQRLDYLLVGRSAEQTGDRLHPQSLVRKLQFRNRHPLAPWVRDEVTRRFDYRCCDSVEEFESATGRAMTENRHIKYSRERHTKDDRPRAVDRRHYVLGWDNRDKKRLLTERLEQLKSEIAKLDAATTARATELANARAILTAAEEASKLKRFDEVDVGRHERELASLEREKQELESSNTAVKALKQRLQQAEQTVESLDNQRTSLNRKLALMQDLVSQRETEIARAEKQLVQSHASGEFEQHAESFPAIIASLSEPLSPENLSTTKSTWTAELRDEIERRRGPFIRLGDRLVEEMNRFLRVFAEQQADLSASRESLSAFLALLAQIREEDLPRHEQKFKDRLNDKVTQEIALFHNALNEERRRIETKVAQLNRSLAALSYRPGTFMKLEPREVSDREISDFRRALRECLDDAYEGSSEANEARFLRIEKLVARLADTEKTRWRDKVIDVRNWFTFAARELDRESGETRSFHEGSTGQSGGEKAKLAFTILVAAIAYQYDLDPESPQSGRFQFVVVDEMFSKIDDQNAEYALKLFERFGLQLLIVAPLDAKARVTEPYVNSYLQVVKDESTGRSQLFSMTAREYEEVVAQFSGGPSEAAAQRMTPK